MIIGGFLVAIKIMQYKQTECAWAPDELSKAINKYSDSKSICVFDFHGENFKKYQGCKDVDVIHFHNKYFETTLPALIQYHSEPERCTRKYPKEETQCSLDNTYYKTVISQYHATLPEYKEYNVVRNIIDFECDSYRVKPVNKIKIGYSPSILENRGKYYNKGYQETKKILENINKKHGIEFDIITNVPLNECLRRKSNCNIIIDECVTGSFHRSGLEGLALGKLTICGLSNEVVKILSKASNTEILPFLNVFIGDLENKLVEMVESKTNEEINNIGLKNREWMQKYWHPDQIVKEFLEIYKMLLEKKNAK